VDLVALWTERLLIGAGIAVIVATVIALATGTDVGRVLAPALWASPCGSAGGC